jgi:hypothetical protein
MTRAQVVELIDWLTETVSTISHGEVSLTLRVREGHVHQVLKDVIQSQLIATSFEAEEATLTSTNALSKPDHNPNGREV